MLDSALESFTSRRMNNFFLMLQLHVDLSSLFVQTSSIVVVVVVLCGYPKLLCYYFIIIQRLGKKKTAWRKVREEVGLPDKKNK